MAQDFTNEQLRAIFTQAVMANPRHYGKEEFFNASPVEDMLGSSPLVDYIRQRLPEKLGDSKAGQWLDKTLYPDQPQGSRVREALQNLRTGGYTQKTQGDRARIVEDSPTARYQTVRVGRVPTQDMLGEVPTGDSFRAAAAQAGGVAVADLATDGARNIWWFLNAPQAVGSLATLAALHQAGKPYLDERSELERGPLLRNRNLRLAATVPTVALASLGVGNVLRNPGYAAALPQELDKTQTVDPIGEALSRFFLGRTGELLPYDEFYKERPDVSKGEYDAYKAYLFGNASPLKATLDGIHGPEVTFMGKSVPLATGVVPVAAAALGAGLGIRKAGRRLRSAGRLQETAALKEDEAQIKGDLGRARNAEKYNHDDVVALENELKNANLRYEIASDANSRELAKQALLYSSMYGGGAYAAGQTLEAIRRAAKGQAPTPEEQAAAREESKRRQEKLATPLAPAAPGGAP